MPYDEKKLTEEELAKEISEQFLFSKRYLDNIHERMNEQEELYRTYIDSSTYPHTARVFDPRVFRIIETITPRLVSNEPYGSFYPQEKGDEVTSQILNALMKYDWRRADMFPKLVKFVKSMLIFGTAFGRVYWDFRETEKTRMVPTEINGKMMWSPQNKEKIKVTEYDAPNFDVLNIYDCFPDPNATEVKNMRWFIYRDFVTLKELESRTDLRGNSLYKNLDQVKEIISQKKEGTANTTVQTSYLQYREHRRIMLSSSELVGQDASNPEFVRLRRFTKDGWCEILPEFNTVIREIENPYFDGELPIIYGVDYPYPGELYGMGEIEPIDRIQRAINAVLNQRLDNVQLTLRTMWKVRKGAGIDLHTLISAPGNIIQTEDMAALEPIQIPDVTGSTFVNTMNYLTSALQNGSGITDYTTGVNTADNTVNSTATGVRLIQQEANAQFKLKIQLFNHMVIAEIANKWKDLRIQYTTEEQKLRILGKEDISYMMKNTDLAKTSLATGEMVTPGDFETPTKLSVSKDGNFAFLNLFPEDIQPAIVGDYDFIPTISSEQLMDKALMLASIYEMADRFKDPIWQQGLATKGKMIDYELLTQKIVDKTESGINPKDLIVDLPQPQQQPMTSPEMMGQGMNMPIPMNQMMPQETIESLGQGGMNG